jgi:outer membrane protein OmpA-like peptidoglycan-associated protein
MVKAGCLCMTLLSVGCSHFHTAAEAVPTPLQRDVAEARNISTHQVLAQDIDPIHSESIGIAPRINQWVAPGCALNFFTLGPRRSDRSASMLKRYLEGAEYTGRGYLSTYQRHMTRSTFAQGKSDLSEALKQDLSWFAQSLTVNALPISVVVIGHSSVEGAHEFNDTLSAARARNTLDYLTQIGVAKERIHAVAAGEFMPPGNFHPRDLSDRSRRVELVTFIRGPEARVELGSRGTQCRKPQHGVMSISDSGDRL